MPNWNNNLITLTAKTDEAKKQLHTFIDKHVIVLDKRNWNDSLLDLDNDSIIPKPDGVDWYEFSLKEWGSKWGFCHTAFLNNYGEVIETKDDLHSNLESTGEIVIKTDCAWSPADGLMKKICELYPDIEFLCEWGEEQVTEYYGIYTYNKEDGWQEKYKKDIDVDEAYNMLDRLGLVNSDEDDGYFPNHITGLVDYDERLNADSEEYLTEDQREGIVFGDVSDDSALDEKNMITPEQNFLTKE